MYKFGEIIKVKDNEDKTYCKRIFIAKNDGFVYCVGESYESDFNDGFNFEVYRWECHKKAYK